MRPSGVNIPGEDRRVLQPTTALSRRMLLSAGGVTLLSACGVDVGKPAARPEVTSPFPRPRSGAPFPGDDGTAGPGDSHTNDSPPPDTVTPAPGVTSDPAPPTGKPQFYVHEGDKAIALTIDDGPSATYTPQVLDLLAHYKIPATFCMIGRNAARNASLVQEVTAAGHLVANHTFSHPDLSKLDAGAIAAEIERTTDALTKGGAKPPTFFRAPGGNWSPAVFQVCQQLNLRPLDWSVDPKDWSRPGSDHIVSTVMGHARTGSIILEHDGGGDRSQTVAALSQFIPQLRAAGYRFVQP